MMSERRPDRPSGRETTESSPSPIANRGDDPVDARDPANGATGESLPVEMTSSGTDLSGYDLYRCIVESANQGIWTIDREQRTTFINAKLAETLGYRPEEVVGRPAGDLVFPEDQAEGDQRWVSRRRGEQDQSEFRLRRKDGSEVWFHAATSPLLDSDGRFVGALGFFADITERRRADEALRESERQARLLADAMPHIVWTARRRRHGRLFQRPMVRVHRHVARGIPVASGLAVGGPPRRPRATARGEGPRRRGRPGLPGRRPAARSRGDLPVAHGPLRAGARRFGPGRPDGSARPRTSTIAASPRRRCGPASGRFRFLAESIPQMVWTASPRRFRGLCHPPFPRVPRRRSGSSAGLGLGGTPPSRRSASHGRRLGKVDPRGVRVPYRVPVSQRRDRRIPLVPGARAAPAQRRRPGRTLVWHLHRHRRSMASPAGDRTAQPQPPGPDRRIGDDLRDGPDRDRHRRGRRVPPDPVEPGPRADPGDRAGSQRIAGPDRSGSGRSTSGAYRDGRETPARGDADAGGGPDRAACHGRGIRAPLRRRAHQAGLWQRIALVRRGRESLRIGRRIPGRDRVEEGRGGPEGQRGAVAPGRPGDRPGPLRPGPHHQHPTLVGSLQGDLRAPARCADHPRRILPAAASRGSSAGPQGQSNAPWIPRATAPTRPNIVASGRTGPCDGRPAKGRAYLRRTGRRSASRPDRRHRAGHHRPEGRRGAIEGGQGGGRDGEPGEGPFHRRAQPRASHAALSGGHRGRPARDDPGLIPRGPGIPGDDPPQYRARDPADRRPPGPQPGDQREAAARPPADASQRPGATRTGHRRRRGPREGADRRDRAGREAGPGRRRPGAAAAGDLEPGQERGQVHLERRHDPGRDPVSRARAGSRSKCGTPARGSAPRPCRTSSTPSSRGTRRSPSSSAAWDWDCRSPRRSSTGMAGRSGWPATGPASGPPSR